MNSNLIETIDLVRKNKKNFVSEDEYVKIITNLYNEITIKNKDTNKMLEEIENTIVKNFKLSDYDKEEQKKLFLKILGTFTIKDILKITNINKLCLNNQLFELFFIENKLMEFNPDTKYHIQSEPIINNYDKEYLISFIKVLLYLCDTVEKSDSKVIIAIIIFDTIFKNFQFVLDHNKFALTIKAKLDEFNHQKEKFDIICNKFNLDRNFLTKWIETIDNIN